MNAYMRRRATPALTVKTGYGYPVFLSHTVNVLILESLGGASDHVTVIAFQNSTAFRSNTDGVDVLTSMCNNSFE